MKPNPKARVLLGGIVRVVNPTLCLTLVVAGVEAFSHGLPILGAFCVATSALNALAILHAALAFAESRAASEKLRARLVSMMDQAAAHSRDGGVE